MMKLFTTLTTIFLVSNPSVFATISQPKDVDWEIKFDKSDFMRQSYQQDIYKIGSEGNFKYSLANWEQRINIAQGMNAIGNKKYSDGYQYHLNSWRNGGESGLNTLDTAIKASSEMWDNTKQLLNFDKLERLEYLPKESSLTNEISNKVIEFKMNIKFEINLFNGESVKFEKEFKPHYSFDTGRLCNDEINDFGETTTLLGFKYEPKVVFEKTLAVHNKRNYDELSWNKESVMPRFWIMGPYSLDYFQTLDLNVPENEETYSTLDCKINEMSVYKPINVLDFKNSKHINLNIEYNPLKNQQLSGNDIYSQVDKFVKENFVKSNPIELYYENIKGWKPPYINPFASTTELIIPISYIEDNKSVKDYQKIIDKPFVTINLRKKIDLVEIKVPELISYEKDEELTNKIAEILKENYLTNDEVKWNIEDNKLIISSNSSSVVNQIAISLYKKEINEPEKPSEPEQPIEDNNKEPDNKEVENKDENSNKTETNEVKKNKNLKLLWLILPIAILIVAFVWLTISILKKRKKKMVK
ncbi:hypothetical protein [Mesoplasma lactucae]|uniref:Uncharacterized protein n=1 Tax=Mesoplasma lactucae ATCC 49193 TaxID=81460 RepID=A0A291IS73_9MOLU|nr:hypothetical protein [Mesoplasma lactucae]ATG97541.1 hypothetical protein CP520_02120 [Mesoplasma lactucae ATCC 49193]ATZ20001.1 hypothetical protein MLACT_v1c01790 [Mesoplasma lactucae ATCC 49193]MCL8217048.1 hypothetical protein [Mesoplasma lactucae ATCC 49193]